MKILVTGKNGQVGRELLRSLSLLGEVVGTGSADLDLADEVSLRNTVRAIQPTIIVNAAAYTAVDRAESEPALAEAVNARAPQILAEEADRSGAVLVHFSTDYVFDGLKLEPYLEEDIPNPQSVYGASKLAGEIAVQSTCERHLILRTSWVLGTRGSNFARTMLRLASERDELQVVDDQHGVPTSAAFLADISGHLLKQTIEDLSDFPFGLYHAVPDGRTDWHAYATYVIERARRSGHPVRVGPGAIHPIESKDYPTPARRPANSILSNEKLGRTFRFVLPDWQYGVDRVLDEIL